MRAQPLMAVALVGCLAAAVGGRGFGGCSRWGDQHRWIEVTNAYPGPIAVDFGGYRLEDRIGPGTTYRSHIEMYRGITVFFNAFDADTGKPLGGYDFDGAELKRVDDGETIRVTLGPVPLQPQPTPPTAGARPSALRLG